MDTAGDMIPTRKTFSFDAGSFAVDAELEMFLRDNHALRLDFGSSAYIDAEIAVSLLQSLWTKSCQLPLTPQNLPTLQRNDSDIARLGEENNRLGLQNAVMNEQIKSMGSDLEKATKQLTEYADSISLLRNENSKLQKQVQNFTPNEKQNNAQAGVSNAPVEERTLSELRRLRLQHADALASIKVLEEENEQLSAELEVARKHTQQDCTVRTGNKGQT